MHRCLFVPCCRDEHQFFLELLLWQTLRFRDRFECPDGFNLQKKHQHQKQANQNRKTFTHSYPNSVKRAKFEDIEHGNNTLMIESTSSLDLEIISHPQRNIIIGPQSQISPSHLVESEEESFSPSIKHNHNGRNNMKDDDDIFKLMDAFLKEHGVPNAALWTVITFFAGISISVGYMLIDLA